MNVRHKWADVIMAFANGKSVQFRNPGVSGPWRDSNLDGINNPGLEWRIKPSIKKFRVALYVSGHLYATDSDAHAAEWEIAPGFDRWLTDWIVYETN